MLEQEAGAERLMVAPALSKARQSDRLPWPKAVLVIAVVSGLSWLFLAGLAVLFLR